MTTILLIEDEPRIAAFVSRGLESAGYTTVIVEDGAEGLARALADDIDLVLLDVGLPTIDGFEVLRRLRAQGSSVPVIMLTARSSTRDTVEGLDAGANDYVSKPFTFDELLARVRSRLRESSAPSGVSVAHGDVVLDILARRATVGRTRSRAVRARVRPRRAVPAQPRPCAEPRTAAQPRVGNGLRPGLERRGRLRPLPARQARRSPHHHRPGRRVPMGVTARASDGAKKPPVLGEHRGLGEAGLGGCRPRQSRQPGGTRDCSLFEPDVEPDWSRPDGVPASAGGRGSVRLPAPESFEVSWSEPLFFRTFSATLDSRRVIHASMRAEDQPRCSAQAYAASHEPDSWTSVTNCSSVAAEGSPICVCTIGGDETSSGSGAGTVSG